MVKSMIYWQKHFKPSSLVGNLEKVMCLQMALRYRHLSAQGSGWQSPSTSWCCKAWSGHGLLLSPLPAELSQKGPIFPHTCTCTGAIAQCMTKRDTCGLGEGGNRLFPSFFKSVVLRISDSSGLNRERESHSCIFCYAEMGLIWGDPGLW